MHKKTQLALGVATAAMISGFATPANAACTVDGSTVTCTADSTAAEVNAAMAAAGGSNVTLNIATDANVTQPGGLVLPPQQGAVAIDNDGDLGSDAARVGVLYFGTPADDANTFDLANSGSISDQVRVFNVGGDMTFENSGVLGNGIDVFTPSEGAISFSSTGDIDSDSNPGVQLRTRGDIDAVIEGNVGTSATDTDDSDLRSVNAFSQQSFFVPTETTTETVGTATTTTTTSGFTREGGAASVDIGEDANTGAVTVFGLESASANVDGAVGSETEIAQVGAFSNTTEQNRTDVFTSDGADSSSSTTLETSAIGGTAEIAIGETGAVSGDLNASGLAGADISVGGMVGLSDNPAGAFASSNRTDSLRIDTSSVIGTVSASSIEQSNETVGGTASVAVGETGTVTGGVSASGFAGADVSLDGTIGLPDNPSFVNSNSSGSFNTFARQSTFDSDTGASTFAQASTNSSTGSDASILIGETGVANASVNAFANGDASIDNAGVVSGSVSANASGSDSSDGFVSSFDGVSVSESARFSTSETTGGTASASVSQTGSVTGGVSASGFAGADISLDGTVGTNASPSFVSASSSGNANTFAQESTFDSATGASTFAQASTNSSTGSDASILIGETGVANASVNAFANGDANIDNAGVVSGSVSANASGSDSSSGSLSSSDGLGNSESASFSTSESTGGNASINNAAGGLIGLDATAPVSVNAFGNESGSVSNAGRINGNVSAGASGSANESANSDSFVSSTDATTGATTSVNESIQASSSTNLGGDASFANSSGGLVTGRVDVNGAGSADVVNDGAVIGTTFASSQATDRTFANESTNINVFAPGADGGTTSTFEQTQTRTSSSSGGDVTGIYAGTNGAVQFAPPFGGASDGSVTQFANGNSSAVVSGTIFGGFNGQAFGSDFSETSASSSETVFDADGDLRSFDSNSATERTDRQSDSNSSLLVDGGTITGNASLYATGSASAQIANGGAIDGSLSLTAEGYGGSDFVQTISNSESYDEDGLFVSGERVSEESSQQIANTGNVSVAIGEGTVGGSVSMNGAAGTNSFTLGAEGVVGGSVSQQSNSRTFGSERTQATARTATATGGVDTTDTVDFAQTSTASGGDVSAAVAGTIGNGDLGPQEYGSIANAGGNSLALSTNAGSAEATVTGQVRNGISVIASGSDSTSAFQDTRENGFRTAFASQSTSSATGGTATLVVDAADRDIPANFGNIQVRGRSGSTATIGADSTVLAATNGAFMQVGEYFSNTTSTLEDSFMGPIQTGRIQTFSRTIVGGNASLLNNGRIGFDGGATFNGDDANVFVISPTMAEATNNGQIYGSIVVESLFTNFSSTTTRTGLDDSVTRVDTRDRTYAASGGSAMLANNGLITGNASLAALDGTAVNDGVLLGDLLLGRSVDNYTTRTTDTLTQLGEEEVLDLADAIEQGYAVEQNGLLGGTIRVNGAFGLIDDTVRTSNITADIALNSGSVTGGGVVAEYDEETGERFTTTNVTLNGSGYLGLGSTALAELEDAFSTIDPAIAARGDLSAFAGGARVLGVDTVTKTGSGVFLITGADFMPSSNTNRFADYTFDIGTFAITGGEIQLATIGDEGVFGIRGNIANSAGLVLGSRVEIPAPLFGTNQSVTAIDGVEVYQNGNFVQSGSGTLSVGVTPTLVRVIDPAFSAISTSTNPLAVQQIGLASGLFTTPENAFGQAFTDLGTGFLTVDGNFNLAGTVELVSPTSGLFTDGQTVDIASVSGTVSATANVELNRTSNFVTFDLATRAEGGRTIVFVSADRAGFETVGNNQNAIAAGTALSQALPEVVATIRAGSAGGIGIGGDQFVLAQDMANIFAGFDSLLTMDQVTTALNELASGEFYGSLTTLETTAPFVDAISSRRVPVGASGFNVWLAPSGDFIEIEGDTAVGSADLNADNYGASAGFGIATGNGEIGVGFGYGRIAADSRNDLLQAEADTWMIGAYVRQGFGNFSIGADLVYGWSDWTASRTMPTLSRVARAEFDSTELRGDLRAEYMFDFGGGWIAPFGQLAFRKFDLEGFTEEGAGSIGLVVQDADDTVLTPILGARAGTTFDARIATLRPELTLSYSFNDDNSSFRDVAYLGAPNTSFRLQGVEPEGYFTIGAGLFADIGANSGAFVRGSYATGGNVNVASVNAGVTIGF